MKKLVLIAFIASIALSSCRGSRKYGCPNHLFTTLKIK